MRIPLVGSETEGRDRRHPVVADVLAPLIRALIGTTPVRIEFWDGSSLGPPRGGPALLVRSPHAVRRLLWSPGELGVGRAYVAGDIDAEGDLFEVLALLRPAGRDLHGGAAALRALPAALAAGARLGLVGRPLPPPPEEARVRWGVMHSPRRDAAAISHHYDVGNDFYELVLGPAMTYSCAFFADESMTLSDAQWAKHELVCRKLGLHERFGARLLDVGCGWGSMVIHAARHHGARAVGITLSREQAAYATRRVEREGLADSVEIRCCDYRALRGERFDAISSIGMFEHVGRQRMDEYFHVLRSLLGEHGRLVNHAISSVGGSRLPRRSFAARYVFPDGELIDVGEVVLAMERAGFEVRDVESLREHYGRTLRSWVANLRGRWAEAVALVGEGRARVWLLYMAASALGFDDGGLGIHQVLGVVPAADGSAGMPRTRRGLVLDSADA